MHGLQRPNQKLYFISQQMGETTLCILFLAYIIGWSLSRSVAVHLTENMRLHMIWRTLKCVTLTRNKVACFSANPSALQGHNRKCQTALTQGSRECGFECTSWNCCLHRVQIQKLLVKQGVRDRAFYIDSLSLFPQGATCNNVTYRWRFWKPVQGKLP